MTNEQDKIYQKKSNFITDFKFDEKVTAVFDDMLERSVPFYREVLRMSSELTLEFYKPNDQIIDLGCSTGNLLTALLASFDDTQNFNYHGIDSSLEMIKKCKNIFSGQNSTFKFSQANILEAEFSVAKIFHAHFTFQFLRPLERPTILKKIYDNLPAGGVLIFSEKLLENSSAISNLFVKEYYKFKSRNNYSQTEIDQKRTALENILIPYKETEHKTLIEQTGFSHYSMFFKWYNFASFIAIK